MKKMYTEAQEKEMDEELNRLGRDTHEIDRKFGVGIVRKVGDGHRKPVTRRDFMSIALNATSSMVVAPSIVTLLTQKVAAQDLDCSTIGTLNQSVPVLIIDCAGGIDLGYDFIFGGREGQLDLLPAQYYGVYGRPLPEAPGNGLENLPVSELRRDYGIVMHPRSPFFRGIDTRMLALEPTAKPMIDGFVIGCRTSVDTSSNLLSPAHFLSQLQLNGSLAYAIGNEASDSGTNSSPARGSYQAATRPTRVNGFSSARALSGNDALATLFGRGVSGSAQVAEARISKFEAVLRTIRNMSESQRPEFTNLTLDEQVNRIVSCGYLEAERRPRVTTADSIIPLAGNVLNEAADPALAQCFGGNNPQGRVQQLALVTRLLYERMVGVGCVTIGGHDDHAIDPAQAPDTSHLEVGDLLARVISYFHRRNQNLPSGGSASSALRLYRYRWL